MSVPALELRGIDKRFGAVTALDGASVRIERGTVHAILGENGAGKSTLMRIAFGLIHPDAGTVEVDGIERRFASSGHAIAAGLGMVHQHFSLVSSMTVAENVALGGRGRYDARRAAEVVRRVGEDTGLVLEPEARVGALGVGAQQRVEIVKALSRDARVLILDEPTAVLAPAEADSLISWLRRFAAGGRSAVIITHKLREVLAAADDITVLRRGRTVATAVGSEANELMLTEAMLGGPPRKDDAPGIALERHRRVPHGIDSSQSGRDAVTPESAAAQDVPSLGMLESPLISGRTKSPPPEAERARPGSADVTIRAYGVSVVDTRGVVRLAEVELEVRPGELVGIVGVEGSGHRELLRVLAGRLAPTSGTLTLPPEVGFVPEDRQHDAVLLDFPLTANIALRGAGARRGRMRWTRWAAATRQLLAAFDVRAAGPDSPARVLSGGNQQKLVLARELGGPLPDRAVEITPTHASTTTRHAIIVENPSRGLDIRATGEVHRRLLEARDAGAAVIVYSSDIDEALTLADRLLVVHAGRVHEVPVERDLAARALVGAS